MFVRKTFPEVLDQIADVEGWLTDEQARRLYDRAWKLPKDAQIVEIGSFRGRSLIVLASAAPAGVGIVSIDPHAGGDRGPQEIAPNQQLGDSDYFCYTDNLTRAGVADRSGSLAQYRREPISGSASLANAVRQVLQLGWFARNVIIKGALTLKLYPLTRLLGHTTRDWPY